jgi:hypothetical protein
MSKGCNCYQQNQWREIFIQYIKTKKPDYLSAVSLGVVLFGYPIPKSVPSMRLCDNNTLLYRKPSLRVKNSALFIMDCFNHHLYGRVNVNFLGYQDNGGIFKTYTLWLTSFLPNFS